MAEPTDHLRPAWAEVDLGAIAHNTALLAARVAPALLCAVVKANGYGHGAVPVGRAALEGGAAWLAVALVEEGVELRDAGVSAPILLLSEPPPAAMGRALDHDLTLTLYSREGAAAAAAAAATAAATPRRPGRVRVHVKVDTGMHRVGANAPDAIAVAAAVDRAPGLCLEGFWTHLAVADEPDHPFTAEQLRRFEAVRAQLADAGLHPELVHAANSAAMLAHPASRYDLVRCGIALYGCAPAAALGPLAPGLRPALSLHARVTMVKEVAAGEGLSYGLRYRLERPSVVATVPLGYADGVPRRLSETGAGVLVGGRRVPLAGAVTMDQLLVDCGPDATVRVGDEVVLLGAQADAEVSAADWAERLGTIVYEVLCGIGPRVPRRYRATDAPGDARETVAVSVRPVVS